MRPQKAYRQVMAAFEFWYKDKDTKMLYAAIPAIKKLIEKDRMYWKNLPKDQYWCEYPTQDVSKFDYAEPDGELMYISDRFNCTHRLFWLYHGLITKQI